MLTIKRLDHISMVAPAWKPQAELLGAVLGFKFLHSFGPSANTGFGGCVLQVPGTALEFEVLEPSGPRSFVQRFLDDNGPGLHHITVEVPDIREAASELERLGITPFGGVTDDGMWHVTYIHPKDSGGILWQLFEPYKFYPEPDRTTGRGAARVIRADHVSMAVPAVAPQVGWLQRVFGMEPVSGVLEATGAGFDGMILSIPTSTLRFEVIAPTQPESFLHRFLAERRPGMHHIALEVESAGSAADGLHQAGFEPFRGVSDPPGWKRHTYWHPKDSGGVLFQLFEERKAGPKE